MTTNENLLGKEIEKDQETVEENRSENEETSRESKSEKDQETVEKNKPENEETSTGKESDDKGLDFSDESAMADADSDEFDLGEESDEEREEESKKIEAQGTKVVVGLGGKSKEELLVVFLKLTSERPVLSIRKEVEEIKVAFYKLYRAEVDRSRKEFVEQGGVVEDFVSPILESEQKFKSIFESYRKERNQSLGKLENEKERNLKEKLQVIEELKELVNSGETMNATFTTFRELQQRWREVGQVPQTNLNDLWETYNHHVENFYSYVQINKELRDLDLKKNLEIKQELRKQAEDLVGDPLAVEAFRKLQKLHDLWRETGPVARELKDELWDGFKDASTQINKRHQDFFEGLKSEQEENLRKKDVLCEKVEALVAEPRAKIRDWNRATKRVIDLQNEWKAIGFAPKKENTAIYKRFRGACDKFFENKRVFFLDQKGEMDGNLKLKLVLTERVEKLSESTDWKQTTTEIIEIQRQWKEIGPVPKKQTDAVWRRFRSACDVFFENKSKSFKKKEGGYEENLEKKEALLKQMGETSFAEGGFELIKTYQRKWSEIGFVPIKDKDRVQKEYKKMMDEAFSTIRKKERSGGGMKKFKSRVETMAEGGDGRLDNERGRLYARMKKLEADIAQLENNIGFFANSKGNEKLVQSVENQIETMREELSGVVDRINLIDAAVE